LLEILEGSLCFGEIGFRFATESGLSLKSSEEFLLFLFSIGVIVFKHLSSCACPRE